MEEKDSSLDLAPELVNLLRQSEYVYLASKDLFPDADNQVKRKSIKEKEKEKPIGGIYYRLFQTTPLSATKEFRDFISTDREQFNRSNNIVFNVGLIIYIYHSSEIQILCSENHEKDRDGCELDLFGGTCNFTLDDSPEHAAAREFLEEITDGTGYSPSPEEKEPFIEILGDCTPFFINRSVLIYPVAYNSLPDNVKQKLPTVEAKSCDLKQNKEKKRVFWEHLILLTTNQNTTYEESKTKLRKNCEEALKQFCIKNNKGGQVRDINRGGHGISTYNEQNNNKGGQRRGGSKGGYGTSINNNQNNNNRGQGRDGNRGGRVNKNRGRQRPNTTEEKKGGEY